MMKTFLLIIFTVISIELFADGDNTPHCHQTEDGIYYIPAVEHQIDWCNLVDATNLPVDENGSIIYQDSFSTGTIAQLMICFNNREYQRTKETSKTNISLSRLSINHYPTSISPPPNDFLYERFNANSKISCNSPQPEKVGLDSTKSFIYLSMDNSSNSPTKNWSAGVQVIMPNQTGFRKMAIPNYDISNSTPEERNINREVGEYYVISNQLTSPNSETTEIYTKDYLISGILEQKKDESGNYNCCIRGDSRDPSLPSVKLYFGVKSNESVLQSNNSPNWKYIYDGNYYGDGIISETRVGRAKPNPESDASEDFLMVFCFPTYSLSLLRLPLIFSFDYNGQKITKNSDEFIQNRNGLYSNISFADITIINDTGNEDIPKDYGNKPLCTPFETPEQKANFIQAVIRSGL